VADESLPDLSQLRPLAWGYVLVDVDGRIIAASDTAAAWIAASPAAAEALAIDALTEIEVGDVCGRRAELRAEGGSGGWLWVLERAAPGRPAGLTARQAEVAELVAAGATNAEVARHLSVGEETIKTHVRRIYATLGVTSRIELAARLRELDRNQDQSG
jgi:DNA-binding NarL/FixJ family response regulator